MLMCNTSVTATLEYTELIHGSVCAVRFPNKRVFVRLKFYIIIIYNEIYVRFCCRYSN